MPSPCPVRPILGELGMVIGTQPQHGILPYRRYEQIPSALRINHADFYFCGSHFPYP
jgi:hypothetical protein